MTSGETGATLTAVGTMRPSRPRTHVLGDLLAGAVLRLSGRRAEVRGEDDVVELDERRVGARLDLEDVDAGAGDLAAADRVGERGHLVDAAAGGVDHAHAVLHLRELLGAEHADGVLGLGQVHGDEVGERAAARRPSRRA